MSVETSLRGNPLFIYIPPHLYHFPPLLTTFLSEIPPRNSKKGNLFPLLIALDVFFYYIKNPDKKGKEST